MKSISLFSGAGGLDLGCEAAGFSTIAAVELDPTARETMLANRPQHFGELDSPRVFADITEVSGHQLLNASETQAGEVDLLHGGPPCTPFSKSGYWLEYKRKGADPNASLLDEYVRILREVRPRAFLMENVYGLAYRNHNQSVFRRFGRSVRDAGYTFDAKVLLAADFGVPQLRQRLFCVGLRRECLEQPDEWRFAWPAPSHSGPHETRTGWNEDLPPARVLSGSICRARSD